MPAVQPSYKGPWTHRFLVHLFTVAFAVLVYWLLSFVLSDIGSWPGPDYTEFEKQRLDPAQVEKSRNLEVQIGDIERRMTEHKTRQEILRDSTANSQRTMDQLLEVQRLALQQKVTPAPEELTALAESEKLFLSNQQQYQLLNEEIAKLNGQLQNLQAERRGIEKALDEQREPVRREFQAEYERHQLKMAALKLAALAPLLVVALVLFLRRRRTVYAPLIYAFGVALMLKVTLVMHEYFPARYFKYILILACLAVVLRILTSLLRMIGSPQRNWLLKQYREAYETFVCPICEFPIRRGPRKYLYWTRRTLPKLRVPALAVEVPEQPYTCPLCATPLYEECPSCHGIRHALLPACEKCGAEKPLTPLSETKPAPSSPALPVG
jgi:hypothetical protein